jgi:hypothetical protein
VPIQHRRGRLEEASQGHVEPAGDVEPIAGLVDKGCDLEVAGRRSDIEAGTSAERSSVCDRRGLCPRD